MTKNIYTTLPETLRTANLSIFVLYRLVPKENGKLDKVPYQPSGSKASPTDKADWVTYDEAVAAYETGDFDGIGVIVVPPLCCIDLDNLRDKDTCELHPVAEDIFSRVPGWTEQSVSGNGVHIFAFCDDQFPHTKHKWIEDGQERAVEIYTDKRFIALTGTLLEGSADDLDGYTGEIKSVYDKYIAPHYDEADTTRAYVSGGNTKIDIDDRLKLAYQSQSGSKIKRLMDGDLSDHANDHSAADLALCMHLAFWLDNDPISIEQAFGQSLLSNRQKWRQRADYRNRTIQASVKATKEVYSAAYIRPKVLPVEPPPEAVPMQPVTPPQRTDVEKVLAMADKWCLSTMVVPPITYLYDPYLIKGTVTAITGEAAHGKSTLALSILHEVAQDPDVLVVYCDADNPASIAKERSDRLRGSLPDRIMYWGGFSLDEHGRSLPPWDITDPRWIEFIQRCGKHVVIIFDTLNSFMGGGNENDNGVVGNIMNHLRAMTNAGASAIIIHHTGKSVTSKESRGASSFKGGVDQGWLVESYIVDTEIKSMTTSAWKSRLGKTAKSEYKMVGGRPTKVTAIPSSTIYSWIKSHAGKTKEQIEGSGKGQYTRQAIRDAIDNMIVAGQVKIENRRLVAQGQKATSASIAPLFVEDATQDSRKETENEYNNDTY